MAIGAFLVVAILVGGGIMYAAGRSPVLVLPKTTQIKTVQGQTIPLGWQSYSAGSFQVTLPPDLQVVQHNSLDFPLCVMAYSKEAKAVSDAFTNCNSNGGLLEHGYVIQAIAFPKDGQPGSYGRISLVDIDDGVLETITDPHYHGDYLRYTRDSGCLRSKDGKGFLRYCYDRTINFSADNLNFALTLRAAGATLLDVQNYKAIFDKVAASFGW